LTNNTLWYIYTYTGTWIGGLECMLRDITHEVDIQLPVCT